MSVCFLPLLLHLPHCLAHCSQAFISIKSPSVNSSDMVGVYQLLNFSKIRISKPFTLYLFFFFFCHIQISFMISLIFSVVNLVKSRISAGQFSLAGIYFRLDGFFYNNGLLIFFLMMASSVV